MISFLSFSIMFLCHFPICILCTLCHLSFSILCTYCHLFSTFCNLCRLSSFSTLYSYCHLSPFSKLCTLCRFSSYSTLCTLCHLSSFFCIMFLLPCLSFFYIVYFMSSFFFYIVYFMPSFLFSTFCTLYHLSSFSILCNLYNLSSYSTLCTSCHAILFLHFVLHVICPRFYIIFLLWAFFFSRIMFSLSLPCQHFPLLIKILFFHSETFLDTKTPCLHIGKTNRSKFNKKILSFYIKWVNVCWILNASSWFQ